MHGVEALGKRGWPVGMGIAQPGGRDGARRPAAGNVRIPGLSSSSLVNGFRFQVFITDQEDKEIAQLEARHRGHARVENRIRCGKATGLENLPFHDFMPNCVWLELVLAAQDLIAFFQNLCLRGEAQQWDPKALSYRPFHTAARVVRTGRRLYLRLQQNWRWTPILYDAFRRLRRLEAAA